MGVKQQGIAKSKRRYKFISRTLLFVTHNLKVLLLKGAPDKKIWPNLYNGVGGHVEAGETIISAVRREAEEEIGLTDLQDLQLCGLVTIKTEETMLGIQLFIYRASSPNSHVKTSIEGAAHWVDWTTLPHNQMVPDLPVLLPRVLSHSAPEPFYGHYWYDEKDKLQIHIEDISPSVSTQ